MDNQTIPPPAPKRAERREALLAQREQIERRLKELAARDSADRRKAEQRAKFLLGGVVLARAPGDPVLLQTVLADLPEKDRDLVKTVVGRKATTANTATQSAPG